MDESSPYLIVGLGNPGERYSRTLHNLGFWVIDHIAKRWGVSRFKESSKGWVAEHAISGRKIVLVKPTTFMNLSGECVQSVCHFYKINVASHLVVVYDDLDTPLGKIRLRKQGGSGGHNGIKSLLEHLGTQDFLRIRMGIGQPQQMPAEAYVLSKPTSEQLPVLEKATERTADSLECIIKDGFDRAMNLFNKEVDVE